MKLYALLFYMLIPSSVLIGSDYRPNTVTPALQQYIKRAEKENTELHGGFWADFWYNASHNTRNKAKATRKKQNRHSKTGAFLRSATVNVPEAAYNSYQMHKDMRLSNPFAEDLIALDSLIDHTKTALIGGKEYMLSTHFKDLSNTGYIEKKLTIPATLMKHNPASENQYELYLMPSTPNLVPVFDMAIYALQQSHYRNDIAFMAIRPTPHMHNAEGQPLPRIIIVFKPEIPAAVVEECARILYLTLKDAQLTIPEGYWPRYSERIVFKDASIKPTTAEHMRWLFFVGIGNSDLKTTNPELFERKKIMGLARRGDRAYPKDAGKKIDIITIDNQ